jgi:paraquat-inducible protein B
MSIRANPTAIGLFTIGATILAVAGVATLASTSWFVPKSTFISYFNESVHGLEAGAPVKFQGVPVGTVTELLIEINENDKTFRVPVTYEIDLERLTSQAGTFVHLNDEVVLRRQITDGLRAQLQMESFVTGLLYVELSYRSDAKPAEFEERPTAYPEIPTTRSLLAAFGVEAGSVVEDVVQILFRVNEMLEEVDMRGINTAVVASAEAVRDLVSSSELQAAIGDAPAVTAQLKKTLDEMQLLSERLGATIDPLQQSMEGTNQEAVATLRALREAIAETHGFLSTESGVGYQLEQTLASFREAAEALRVLAIALERNPDMLIRGKKPPGR